MAGPCRRRVGLGMDRLLKQLGIEGLDGFRKALKGTGPVPGTVIRNVWILAYNSPQGLE